MATTTTPRSISRLTPQSSKEREDDPKVLGNKQKSEDVPSQGKRKSSKVPLERNAVPMIKRIKLTTQRNSRLRSEEKSDPIEGERNRAVVQLERDVDKDVNMVADLKTEIEKPAWLLQEENVTSFLSKTIKVKSKCFLTSENVQRLIPRNKKITSVFLGSFFFASTKSDVKAMKEDFERAGYICHNLNKDLLLYKLFHKVLPDFEAKDRVISVFSKQRVKAEKLNKLLRISKHTKSLIFSKEAFLVFKEESDAQAFLEVSREDQNTDFLKYVRMVRKAKPEFLKKIPEILRTTENICRTLLLFTNTNLPYLDPKRLEELLKRMLGLSCTKVEAHHTGLVSISFVSEYEALAALRRWKFLNIFGFTWNILTLQMLRKIDRKSPAYPHVAPDKVVVDKVNEMIVPDNTVPEKVVPDKNVPEKVAPDKNVPEKVAPDKFVPDKIVPDKIGLKVIPEEVVPDKIVQDHAIREEIVPGEVVPDHVIQEEIVPNKTPPDHFIEEEIVPEKITPEKVSPDKIVPEKVSPDTVGSDKVAQDQIGQEKIDRTRSFPENFVPDGDAIEILLKNQEESSRRIKNLEDNLRDSNERCELLKTKDQDHADKLKEKEETITKLEQMVAEMRENSEETRIIHDKKILEKSLHFQKEKEVLLSEVNDLRKENENLISHDQTMAVIYNRTIASLDKERQKVKDLENMKTTLMNESLKQNKIKINLINQNRDTLVEDQKNKEECTENLELQKKIVELEKTIQNIDERNKKLTRDNIAFKNKNLELQGLTEKNRQLKIQLSERDFEIAEMEKKLEKKDKIIENLKEPENIPVPVQVATTPNSQETSNEIILLRNEIQKSQEEMGQYFLQKESLRFENNKQKESIAEQEEEIRSLKEKIRRRTTENEEIRTKEKKILDDYDSTLSEMKDIKKENEKLKKIIKSVSSEYPAVLDENNKLKEEKQLYEKTSAYVRELEKQMGNLYAEKNQMENRNKELEKEVKSLERERDDFKRNKKKETQIVQSIIISEKNDSIKQENIRLLKENQDLIQMCNQLNFDLKKETQKTESIDQSSQEEIQNLSNKILKLVGEKDCLQKQVDIHEEANGKLKKNIEELEEKNKKCQMFSTEIKELKIKNKELINEKNLLTQEIKSYKCLDTINENLTLSHNKAPSPESGSTVTLSSSDLLSASQTASEPEVVRLYPNLKSAEPELSPSAGQRTPGHKLPLMVAKPSCQTLPAPLRSSEPSGQTLPAPTRTSSSTIATSTNTQNHLSKLTHLTLDPESSHLPRSNTIIRQPLSATPASVDEGSMRSPSLRVRTESEMKGDRNDFIETELVEWLTEEKARRSDAEIIKVRPKMIDRMKKNHVENVTSDPAKRKILMEKLVRQVNSAYSRVFPNFSLQSQQTEDHALQFVGLQQHQPYPPQQFNNNPSVSQFLPSPTPSMLRMTGRLMQMNPSPANSMQLNPYNHQPVHPLYGYGQPGCGYPAPMAQNYHSQENLMQSGATPSIPDLSHRM